jgi:hypothetical protein
MGTDVEEKDSEKITADLQKPIRASISMSV